MCDLLVEDGGGPLEQFHHLGLGHLLDRLEDEDDVVAELVDIVLGERGHHPIDDPEAALGEAEVAASRRDPRAWSWPS